MPEKSENNFAGDWELIPELCLYQQGEAPVRSNYLINCAGGDVAITVQWCDSAGQLQSTSYGGPVNGSKQVFEGPGITHINFTRVDANTLDSGVYTGDQEVMYARRATSEAGDLMSIVQTTQTQQGSFSNFQVYRRRGP